MKTRFYLCPICGNLVMKVLDSGVKPICCGSEMVCLEAKTLDTGNEKHVPFVEKVGENILKVRIGSTEHPTFKDHHIEFIYIETDSGGQLRYLGQDGPPIAEFCTCKNYQPTTVYEYCNVHGLWKLEISNKEKDYYDSKNALRCQ